MSVAYKKAQPQQAEVRASRENFWRVTLLLAFVLVDLSLTTSPWILLGIVTVSNRFLIQEE